MPFGWINGDGKLIIAIRGLRTFSHSTVSILVAIYLAVQGYSIIQVGLFLTAGSTGAAAAALLAGIFGDSFGRRRMLSIFAALAALTGAALIATTKLPVLAVAAFLGGFSALSGAAGGMGPLEQAILPSTTTDERRTDIFAIYGIVGTGAVALGALTAGLPTVLQSFLGFSEVGALKTMFAGYAVSGAMIALTYTRLSSAVEISSGGTDHTRAWTNPFRFPSRGRIFTLAGLFTVDSFGSGLIPQSLAAFWFFTRFGLQPEQLGLLFFASSVLAAISLWVATRLARRIGLLNTVVFTHIPSSVFLMAVPMVPAAWMAIGLWLLRAFFAQMDVPTSQSYTMAVVGPEERSAMASASMVGRSVGIAAGPSVSTALWSATTSTFPFIVGGTLKIAYDLSLWVLFKRVIPPEEALNPSS
jgi:MFS family permease